MTITERLLKHSIPVPESGCWLWLGHWSPKGYGIIRINGTIKRAHRISYECFIGPISTGSIICHRCDVPCCINPSHLFLGTIEDNNKYMKRKGRYKAPFGQKSGRSKLTEEQMIKIRLDRRPQTAISQEYHIGRQQIYRIKHRLSWKGV